MNKLKMASVNSLKIVRTKSWFNLIFVTSIVVSTGVHAENTLEPIGPSQSDFGGVGLMQMPTARMAKKGVFSLNHMDNEEYRRSSVSMQVLPWLETTLRYTDTRTRLYGREDFSGDQTHKDKAADIKINFTQEDFFMPEVSLGFRDIGGTGLFDGEFVVANKQFGPLDMSLGLGWGYLAKVGNVTNPFCKGSAAFCTRPGGYSGSGGIVDGKRFFKGKSAIFGGVEYQTPWHPLRLKLEYDGNDYQGDFARNLVQRSHFNAGAVYRLSDFVDVHLSYQRGNKVMFGITLRSDFNQLRPMPQAKAEAYRPQLATDLTTINWEKLASKLETNAGWKNPEILVNEKELIVQAEQTHYRDQSEAINRATVTLANVVPESIKQFRLVETKLGVTLQETSIDRAQFVASQQQPTLGLAPTAFVPVTQELSAISRQEVVRAAATEPVNYYVAPQLTQSFGGPESFYMYQLGINGVVEAKFGKNWIASGTAYLNVVDNYDQFKSKEQPPDGLALAPVRTLIRKYVSDHPVRINNLQLTKFDQFGQGWYTQVYAGYLEMMFAGVGGEVMYRPLNANWAIGLDMNWVRQRDWNNTHGLLDYKVATGHLSATTKVPYLDNLWVTLSAGQYLAKDRGMTINLAKEFDSGIRAGFFATKTNVSAKEFGEGSFNKGFYVSIPFDLLTIKPSRQVAGIAWVPLTRDGGQQLARKYSLYGLTESRGKASQIFTKD